MLLAVVQLPVIYDGFAVLEQRLGVLQAGVMVAADQMLASLEAAEVLGRDDAAVIGKVADDIDRIVRANSLVPVADERLVHRLDAFKGAMGQHRGIAQVQVCGVINHQITSRLRETQAFFLSYPVFVRGARGKRKVNIIFLCEKVQIFSALPGGKIDFCKKNRVLAGQNCGKTCAICAQLAVDFFGKGIY